MSAPAGTRSKSVPLLHQEVAKMKGEMIKNEQENSKKWKVQQHVNRSNLKAIAKLQKMIQPLVSERAPKRWAGQQQKTPAVFEEPQSGGRRKRACQSSESLLPIQVNKGPIQPGKMLNRAGEPLTKRQILASSWQTEEVAQRNSQAAVVQPAGTQSTRQHPARRSGRR